MMKLTVQDVFDLQEGLADLSEKELNISTSLKIGRISRVVSEEFKTAQETRSKLLQKYKDKDVGIGKIKLKEDKIEEFQQELDELMGQEIQVDIEQIKVDDLGAIQVKPKTINQLNSILKED